jgi:hypothetical protein
MVWKDGVIGTWLPRENRLTQIKADDIQGQFGAILQEFDPRIVVTRMAELGKQGQVEMQIEESPDGIAPVVVTVTYLASSPKPNQRKVLSVDPTTKLVSTIELYQLGNGDYQYEGRVELYEYNQAIDADLFDLANEVPADVTRLDLAGEEIGLAQGQLSDDEVATQVVRQFFESLMARDYDAAGRLLPGIGPRLREDFGHINLIRIVSVGPATPRGGPQARAFTVACTLEVEENGKENAVELGGVHVAPLGGQPGRWVIASLGD